MFGDEETTYTMETTHSAGDLGYAATRYARVASTSGTGDDMLMSGWTTHVTGTSAMAPPPPPAPAPDPIGVSFSLSDDAKDKHFLIADDDNDADTAMADVNSEIAVTSNASAVITPMFVDGANGVSVMEGDNMPFTYVEWNLLQSGVIGGEATFMIQRTTMGANQEMEPTGDVAYVTCGPFNCADGMDAPEPSIADSAVCTAFDPAFTLEVGWVDNDVLVTARAENDATTAVELRDAAAAAMYDDDDGLDIGWVSSSKAKMSVMHHFSGVAKGENYSVAGRDAALGTDKALAMDLGDGTATDADKDVGTSNEDYEPALLVAAKGGECADYASNPLASARGIDMPESCFRIIGSPDYLSGYSIEVSATDAAVAWGSVEWEEDPFEGLTCDSMTFMASEQVDICVLFEDEVEYALDKGEEWVPSVRFNSYTTGTIIVTGVDADDDGSADVARAALVDQWRPDQWSAKLKKGVSGRQFKTLWFDDNLDDKLPKPGTSGFKPGPKGLNDIYDANGNTGNLKAIWKSLLDDDGDLAADDLGKVDLVSSVDDRSTADDERTIELEACQTASSPANSNAYRPRDGTVDDNGTADNADDDWTWIVDSTPCVEIVKATGLEAGETRTAPEQDGSKTASNPDGRADNYERIRDGHEDEATPDDTDGAANWTSRANNRSPIDGADFVACSEGDGGDDEESCNAEWSYDGEVLFASGSFDCTTTRPVSITCEWDADGGLSAGRNRAPDHFIALGDDKNIGNFLTCKAN